MKVLNVLKPVLYLGFFLGLVPYSLHKRSLYIPASLYSLALIFLLWQSYTKILSMILTKDTVTDLFAYGYLLPLQMSLNSLTTFTSWVAVLYRHHMWIDIFDGLKYIEKCTHGFRAKISYTFSHVIQCVGLGFLPVFTVVYFSFYFEMLELNWVVVCGQSLSTTVNILLLTEFLMYLMMVKSNFSALNKELTYLLDYKNEILELSDSFWESNQSHKIPSFLVDARRIHEHLYSLCRHINQCFSLQLLVSICKSIILITVILYNVSLTFLGKGTSSGQNLLVYSAVMGTVLIHNTAELLLLVFICSSVCDQANYTAVLVHKLMNKDLPPGTREELQLFSYQLLHHKVYFSVCGFFNLDFTLLNGVIASVATYLVILIQFQM